MLMRTRDEETAQYFLKASSRITGKRRTLTVQQTGLFQKKYEEIGFGSETEIRETRSHEEHIKNLPVGQMEILMTDNRLGTLHSHLHVRRPANFHLPCMDLTLYPRVTTPNRLVARSQPALQRFRIGAAVCPHHRAAGASGLTMKVSSRSCYCRVSTCGHSFGFTAPAVELRSLATAFAKAAG